MDAIANPPTDRQIIGVIDEIAFQTNLLAPQRRGRGAPATPAGLVRSDASEARARPALGPTGSRLRAHFDSRRRCSGVKLVPSRARRSNASSAKSPRSTASSPISRRARTSRRPACKSQHRHQPDDSSTQQNATMVEESAAASQALSRETDQLATLVEQSGSAVRATRRRGASCKRRSPAPSPSPPLRERRRTVELQPGATRTAALRFACVDRSRASVDDEGRLRLAVHPEPQSAPGQVRDIETGLPPSPRFA